MPNLDYVSTIKYIMRPWVAKEPEICLIKLVQLPPVLKGHCLEPFQNKLTGCQVFIRGRELNVILQPPDLQ